MFEFKLADLGEGIHEAEIVKWYVEPGSNIKEDDPVVEVETDKASVTIPSPVSGKVVETFGELGDTIMVGDILITVDDGSGEIVSSEEPLPEEKESEKKKAEILAEPEIEMPKPDIKKPAAFGRPVPAAPATRKLAREMGIDINQVRGSGPAGRVTPEDVRRFASGGSATASATPEVAAIETMGEAPEALPTAGAASIPLVDIGPLPDFSEFGDVEKEPLISIRRKTARKMATAATIIPHVTHVDEADITNLNDWRKTLVDKSGENIKLSILPFAVKAAVTALKAYPQFNSSLDAVRQEIIYKKYINIGVAVDSGKGLVVPVIKDADRKNVLEISAEIDALASKARAGELSAEDMRGGTFTVSNIGPIGGLGATPIINYPEVAILALGRAKLRPAVVEGRIEPRLLMQLWLSFDHRMVDGADAARFVTHMVQMLENRDALLLNM